MSSGVRRYVSARCVLWRVAVHFGMVRGDVPWCDMQRTLMRGELWRTSAPAPPLLFPLKGRFMEFPGLITIKPDQADLVDAAARIIGESFLEECWTSTYLSAIGGDEAFDRKQEVSRAMIREEVVGSAPYGCAFILPDQAGPCARGEDAHAR